ncbi:restriction endonuclease-like protein [Vibrio alginolyticus]|uniref:restriction endonuclease-like protein n=1 Tax=Vibrio alginolyticus TaxID=663 RepID=UPI00215C6C48|nr:restriction endonuclease-like protein [Vibrio alginolyticus]MCR9352347.1 restriction endonuclease-like protein [Vibrio alginolyticus]MCR9358730.1 restriction endonuclease-like protein [Vibrio alginolyticus]
MPELIRLQTPDFEFSIWANDISQRLSVYQNTMAHRASANHAQPSYELRFAPAAQLSSAIEPQGLVADGLVQSGSDENDLAENDLVANGLAKHAELTLNTPLFFENTQYQFEWVFFSEVTNARLTHRSQGVNEAFRFAPEVKTARGVVPARLTGTINTGNDVGWLRLPLTFEHNGKTQTQHIAFEVLPTKMALHQDLPAMYQAIDKVYPLWRFSLVEKTEQDAATSQQRGNFPLMWLANFAALRERFEQGLKVICAAPHSRLQPTVANIKAAKLKGRQPHKLAEKVKQDFANGQYDKRYAVEKKQLSVDTPENRFIKMAVSKSKRQLAEFEQKLRQSNQAPERQRLSDSFLNELHSWQQPLQKVLGQSFLKEVGAYTGLSRESLVLQQKTGYSAVYRIWQELKFYLDVFGNQSSISMKSVAEIYEVWCFLCLKQILEQNLGFELVENSATKLAQNDFFEYQLKDGFAGAFRFKRSDGVTARLAHEPKFTKKGQSIRSYLVNQEPDIVLEVTLPKSADLTKADSSEEKQFIWLFDAKYRIKTEKNRFDDSNEDIESTDYVPDDAINQMHRYRDALIRLSEPHGHESSSGNAGQPAKKSRPVFGAFALYPGFFDQAANPNPYAAAIEEVGIGAFALLPSQDEPSQNRSSQNELSQTDPTQTKSSYSGHKWLLEFLQTQIGTAPNTQTGQGNEAMYPVAGMAERLYVQEAARIPYYGMRQVLYPDLTMTVALGGQRGRDNGYFEQFEQGTALWYHLPQSTFLQKFKQHIAEEIRYLALASTSDTQSSTKQIDKLWPVKRVTVLPRYAITEEQAGKKSGSADLYYLFELGKPLSLQTPVTNVPHRPMKNSMKLTTLTRLESVTKFIDVEKVYEEAMV